MCHKIVLIARETIDEIIEEVVMGRAVNPLPDWPARRVVAYPQAEVPLIVSADDGLKSQVMTWGFDVSWNSNTIFNTRIETARHPGTMWSESLCERRCVVPVAGFFEPHRTETTLSPRTGKPIKREYLFTSPDARPLFLAGIHEHGHFSIVTTEPNSWVQPIHNRMPRVLMQEEIATWLSTDYPALPNRCSLTLSAEKVELENAQGTLFD